jgi:DNA-binding NarL/FixJ family response regulator
MAPNEAIAAVVAPHPPPATPVHAVRSPAILSRREQEVAALIRRGLTNRQIAEALFVAERTVDKHVEHVLAKLSLRSRAQVAAWAAEHGLTPPTVE